MKELANDWVSHVQIKKEGRIGMLYYDGTPIMPCLFCPCCGVSFAEMAEKEKEEKEEKK